MANTLNHTALHGSRLPELDALRGVAALVVLVHHALVMLGPIDLIDGTLIGRATHTLLNFSFFRLIKFGRGPVLFFFVLSGYVLTRALLKNGSPGLLAFAVQRCVRLLIPVTASVLLSCTLYYLVADPLLLQGPLDNHSLTIWSKPPDVAAVLREVALLQTNQDLTRLNNVLWSLAHEWRLTLLLPLVLLFHNRIWLMLALATAATGFGAMFSADENFVMLGAELHGSIVATVYFALSIASGAALALAGRLPALSREQRIAASIGVVMLAGMTADLAVYLASVLLIVLAQQPGRFQQMLRWRPLLWLGRVSFSLYLIHSLIMVAWLCLLYEMLPVWAIAVSGALLALLATPVFFRCIERPSRDLAKAVERRLVRTLPGKVAAAPAPP
ncbi:acyltransferase [Pseudomonas sp.]|uniref:acyltransferase family protein n=1 Tax=Pseudomonas sp. TaxID=306 RepID=UPI0025E11759|nr:acyltransferase [Pseudomonas sp.]